MLGVGVEVVNCVLGLRSVLGIVVRVVGQVAVQFMSD